MKLFGLTDLEAMGIPLSSTGPIPENLMNLSSRTGAQLLGRVEELRSPFGTLPAKQPPGCNNSGDF